MEAVLPIISIVISGLTVIGLAIKKLLKNKKCRSNCVGENINIQVSYEDDDEEDKTKPKRKRGRPRKNKV